MKEEEIIEKAMALLQSGRYEKPLKGKQVAVIGAGGAGGNIVEDMARNGLNEMEGVESMVINTDEGMLETHPHVNKRVLIGKNVDPRPRGTDGSRRKAKKMVEGARESLEVLIGPYPVIVVIAGLGGGTGSELIVELSKMAVNAGKITMAIPVLPFSVEGGRRKVAMEAMEELRGTGAMIVEMDNDSLMAPALMNLPMEEGFRILNRVILKKIGDLHESTRKAVMDAVLNDIMASMGVSISADGAVYETTITEDSMAMPPAMEMVPEVMTATESFGLYGKAPEGNEPPSAQ